VKGSEPVPVVVVVVAVGASIADEMLLQVGW
jgi:hypothetical protein